MEAVRPSTNRVGERGATRSPDYHSTVDHRTPEGQSHIDSVRAHASAFNAAKKSLGIESGDARVSVKYRLGKNNPHASLYSRGGPHHTSSSQNIKREHAQHADVYIRHPETTANKWAAMHRANRGS
jgi:hypothetical protein